MGDSYTSMVLIGAYRSQDRYPEVLALYESARLAGVAMWLPAVSNVMFALSKVREIGGMGLVEAGAGCEEAYYLWIRGR